MNEGCPICMDQFGERDVKTIQYGCTHKFHAKCIMTWIDTSGQNDNTARCPQCRQLIIEWPSHPRVTTPNLLLEFRRDRVVLQDRRHSEPCAIAMVFMIIAMAAMSFMLITGTPSQQCINETNYTLLEKLDIEDHFTAPSMALPFLYSVEYALTILLYMLYFLALPLVDIESRLIGAVGGISLRNHSLWTNFTPVAIEMHRCTYSLCFRCSIDVILNQDVIIHQTMFFIVLGIILSWVILPR